MEKIQLCFRIKDDDAFNKEVQESILKIKDELDTELGAGNYQIYSCHLNKKIVEQKGFDPTMINFLHNTFGDNYINMCDAETFDEAMENMNIFRIAVASSVDRLYLIKLEIGNIALELELFTNKKVRVF